MKLPVLKVKNGVKKQISLVYGNTFRYLSTDGSIVEAPDKKLSLPSEAKAPLKKGDRAGELIYTWKGKEIGRIPVLYNESIKKATFTDCLRQTAEALLLF